MMPAGPSSSPRGFSIGGSVHTPDPLTGPVLTRQLVPVTQRAGIAEPGLVQPDTSVQAGKKGKGRKAIAGRPVSPPK
jgi:hypothetical protein